MADDPSDGTRAQASQEARRRGWASLAALVAALLLTSLVVLVALSNRDRDVALSRQRHSYEVLIVIRGLDSAMARAEAALGRFVISGETRSGVLYYDQWKLAGQQLSMLGQLTATDTVQQPLVHDLAMLYDARGRELAGPANRAASRQGWPALSLFDRAGKAPSIPRIAAVLDRISANERVTLGQLSAAAARSVARSNFLAALLSALGVLLAVGAIMLGWLAVKAVQARREAGRRATREAVRAESLEHAVDERTRELSLANERLRTEAATRATAEAQLRQVQKMEAVGQLTGGIAHDFNNMLAVVIGGLDLARRRVQPDMTDLRRHLDNALDGAERAAALTKRLLAFARAEPLMPEGVDPGRLIAGMSDLIDRTLGERITVAIDLSADGWAVWCDPHQLENAIVNLAVNARDAMPGGGRLEVRTRNVRLGDHEAGSVTAGEYVRIDVRDTGCGMDGAVLDRVFEPFFTTKPVGKGTGLGLSQIFGFTRQSGGDIVIESTVGTGTCVSVLLPRSKIVTTAESIRPVAVPRPLQAVGSVPGTGQTILVVEDDARVRNATVDALEELDYTPLPAAGGEEALAILATRDDIVLVISDVVMPGMTGPQLIERIGMLYPHVATIFVTGYVGEAGGADRMRGHDVLRKPFTLAGLAAAVSNALSGENRGGVDRAA